MVNKESLLNVVVGLKVTWVTFKPELEKIKTNLPPPPPPPLPLPKKKNSLHFRKWNFLTVILKKFLCFWKSNHAVFSTRLKNKKIHPEKTPKKLIFSQKKAFLILQEMEAPSPNHQKNIIFQETEAQKIPALKKLLIFWEMELFNSKLKKYHIILVSFKNKLYI